MKEREELDEDVEARDIGNIVHCILEDEYSPFIGRRLRPEDFPASVLEGHVERRFREAYGEDLRGRAYLMMLQTKRHLGEYLAKCQVEIIRRYDAEGQDVRPLALEKTHEIVYRGFILTARFDRLELRAENLFVLDYKTSADVRKYGLP